MKRFLAGLLAATLSLAPVAAAAQLLTTGAGKAIAGGAPPAPTFSASRGWYTGRDTQLGNSAALGVTNTNKLSYSFWVNGDNTALFGESLLNGSVMQHVANSSCEARTSPTTSPGFCLSFDNSANFAQFNTNNSIGAVQATDGLDVAGTGVGAFTVGTWNFYAVALNGATGHCAVDKDGVDAVTGGLFTCPSNIAAGVVPDLNNAAGIHFGNIANSNLTSMRLADFIVTEEYWGCDAAGTPWASCTAANTYAPEILAKLRDPATGKAVDIATAPAAISGRLPEIVLVGSGSGAHNVGSTSATCCTASVSNSGVFGSSYGLLLPAYGPGTGIPAGVPTLRVSNRGQAGGGITGFSTSPAVGGATIATNELAVLAVSVRDNTNADLNITCPGTTSDGGATYVTAAGTVFTRLKSTVETASNAVQAVVCYGTIHSGEASSFPVSWSPANAGSGASATWWMGAYTNVKTSGAVGTHAVSTSAASPVVTPVNNTTAANSRVVSIFTNYNAGNVVTTTSFGEVRHIIPNNGTEPQIEVVDEIVASSGAAMSRSVTNAPTWGGNAFELEILAP